MDWDFKTLRDMLSAVGILYFFTLNYCVNAEVQVKPATDHCFPEISLCLQPTINTSVDQQYFTQHVEFSCAVGELAQVIDIAMEILSNDHVGERNNRVNQSDCSMNRVNQSDCSLNQNQLSNEHFVQNIKSSPCTNTGTCYRNITYSLPSNSTLNRYCGITTGEQTLIPVLKLTYKCFKTCDVSTAASAYFHTLNKTCTTNVNVGTLYQVHVFLSSYALVGSLINHIIINMALVPLDLSALAISDIHGTCDVLIRPSSSIILGVYKILVSHLVSKPDPPSSCMQRLVLYNVYSNDRRIYCPDNITKFNVHVITGSQEVQRFQIWYETDNPIAEAAFYVPVEAKGGEASITCCGTRKMARAPAEDTETTIPPEMTTIIESPSEPTPSSNNNLMIILTAVFISVVVILGLLVILILVRYKISHKTEPPPVQREIPHKEAPQEEKEDGSDNIYEVYDVLDEDMIGYNGIKESNAPAFDSLDNRTNEAPDIPSHYLIIDDGKNGQNKGKDDVKYLSLIQSVKSRPNSNYQNRNRNESHNSTSSMPAEDLSSLINAEDVIKRSQKTDYNQGEVETVRDTYLNPKSAPSRDTYLKPAGDEVKKTLEDHLHQPNTNDARKSFEQNQRGTSQE